MNLILSWLQKKESRNLKNSDLTGTEKQKVYN